MSGSGLLYAAVLGAWAVFLLTRCLKTTPADTSSGVTEGTLLRRRGESDPATYSMLRPQTAGAYEPVVKRSDANGPVEMVARRRVSAATARRHRRVLGTLVVSFVPLLTAYLLGLLPMWPAAIPAGLFFAYLYEVRVRAKKSRATRVPMPVAPPAYARIPAQRGTRSKPADADLTWNPWPSVEVETPTPGPVADIADGWEPRPVPLPTYVTAPKAPPVARRIDVSAGRPWTDVDADDEPTQEFPVLTDELIAQIEAEMAEKAAAEQLELIDEVEIPHQRAVGE
jgi:hypothetical protein